MARSSSVERAVRRAGRARLRLISSGASDCHGASIVAVQRDVLGRGVGGDPREVTLDRGEREAVALQLLHQLEPGDVVGRVVAGPAAPDRRRHQSLGGVEADVAHAEADPVGQLVQRQQLPQRLHALVHARSSRRVPSGDAYHLDDPDSIGVTIGGGKRPAATPSRTTTRTVMAEAFVYDHIRTPRGKGKAVGSLHEVKPVDLVVGLLDEIRTRNPALDPSRVDDVVLGVVTPDRRAGRRHRQDRRARGRLPRDRRRRPAQPLLRLRPRGRQPGRGPGPLRLRGPDPRRRRRVDEPGADGLRRRRLGGRPGHRAAPPASSRRASAPT